MKNTTKARKTREAKKSFATWNENRTPITDEQGNTIVVPEDEIFVPLYDYLEKKLRPKYYISNKSRVISFAKANNPQQRNINDSDEYDTIEIYSDKKKRKISFKLHRAVWFSFAYEYLTNGNTKLKNLTILSFGVDFSKANFKKLLNGDIYEVHHINVNEKDNRLENLLLLHEKVHNILTQMSRKNDSERYKYFLENIDKFRCSGSGSVQVEFDNVTQKVTKITILHTVSEVGKYIANREPFNGNKNYNYLEDLKKLLTAIIKETMQTDEAFFMVKRNLEILFDGCPELICWFEVQWKVDGMHCQGLEEKPDKIDLVYAV